MARWRHGLACGRAMQPENSLACICRPFVPHYGSSKHLFPKNVTCACNVVPRGILALIYRNACGSVVAVGELSLADRSISAYPC